VGEDVLAVAEPACLFLILELLRRHPRRRGWQVTSFEYDTKGNLNWPWASRDSGRRAQYRKCVVTAR
jgi:hypothetical protein